MKRCLSVFVFFLIAQFGLLAQVSPSLADKRIALVIGNSHYKNTPTLPNPVNDASDVAGALTAIGFEVTLKLDAGKREMDQAVAQFGRDSTKADASLFYYAGHGMQYQGRNFVMPVDAELEDEISLRYELTSIDEVKEALQKSKGVKIMVLDACRTNPLAEKFVRSISVNTRELPRVAGYARPEQTSGMIIVYATQADGVANDGAGRNSPFSGAFLKEIKEPGLEIGTMFRRICTNVYAATNGQQWPELSMSLLSEYYLNQAETDQAIWAHIRTNSDDAVVREFLRRYPNSFYAPDARARLELLLARESRLRDVGDQPAKLKQEAPATGVTPEPPIATQPSPSNSDSICKRDEARLGRIRSNPSTNDITKFARELECERLRPQVNFLMAGLGIEPTDVAPAPSSTTTMQQTTIQQLPRSTAGNSDVQACARDAAQLARLRANPDPDQATQFSRNLVCEDLRPQVQRLLESLGKMIAAHPSSVPRADVAPPAPSNLTEPREPANSGELAAPVSSAEVCKHEADELSHIRAAPDRAAAQRFASQLKCGNLKAQAARLLESLGD
jgi:hypothetical protein